MAGAGRQDTLRLLLNGLIATTFGALGALLFWLVHLPLPYMLGALSGSALAVALNRTWIVPTGLRDGVRPVIGVFVGSAFVPAVAAAVLGWWPAVLYVIATAFLTGVAGYLFFRLVARFDRPTAFFSSAPAGLGELALLGEMLGGNARTLVVVHSIRVLAVVFSVPFFIQIVTGQRLGAMAPLAHAADPGLIDWLILGLCAIAGAGIGRLLRWPAGILLSAILLSAIVHATGITTAAPPGWLVASLQVLIGTILGARFAAFTLAEARRTVPLAILWAFILLALTFGAAALAGPLLGQSLLTMILATAPGGMVEVTVMALAIGVETAFVVTCQVARVLIVLFFTPVLFRMTAPPPPEIES